MSAAKRQSARAGVIFALALVVLGALVGLLTVALSVAVDGGASLFAERPQLVWLLPVAGLCSYGAYRAVGLDFSWSTARVMEAVRDGRSVPPLLAPAIIVGTALRCCAEGRWARRRRRSRWARRQAAFCAIVFPRVSARCWRQRLWAPLSALCWMPRWRASCSPSRRFAEGPARLLRSLRRR